MWVFWIRHKYVNKYHIEIEIDLYVQNLCTTVKYNVWVLMKTIKQNLPKKYSCNTLNKE